MMLAQWPLAAASAVIHDVFVKLCMMTTLYVASLPVYADYRHSVDSCFKQFSAMVPSIGLRATTIWRIPVIVYLGLKITTASGNFKPCTASPNFG